MTEEKKSQSFAEKYASKKTNFTSQAVQNQQPTKKKDLSDIASKAVPSSLKPVDPQKKMQAELIYLVKGIDAGRNAWYYVLVDRLKLQLFLKALNDDIIHLENYGKILFSAYGEEPSAEVTGKLKEEYGIE
ncbi:MAG: hypothetical protein FJX34_00675 [Alphaproteobacteria bacterium]|nr:hypothetical protein [Alphaproteobacteria bacterium]